MVNSEDVKKFAQENPVKFVAVAYVALRFMEWGGLKLVQKGAQIASSIMSKDEAEVEEKDVKSA
jgi:hypothetical protein